MPYMWVQLTSICERKSVIDKAQFELPPYLREQEAMVGWCTLFLRIVAKEPPPVALPDDLDEREINHWWKAKKWAYANLNRLFVRYAALSSLTKPSGKSD